MATPAVYAGVVTVSVASLDIAEAASSADIADGVTVGVTSLADAGVASPADVGVASLADLAGGVTIGVTSLVDAGVESVVDAGVASLADSRVASLADLAEGVTVGTPQDCVDHIRKTHYMNDSAKAANLGRWFPPWMVTRAAWHTAQGKGIGCFHGRGPIQRAWISIGSPLPDVLHTHPCMGPS